MRKFIRTFAPIFARTLAVFAWFALPALDVARADDASKQAAELELRGSEHFRAARFAESVADFDAEIKLEPRRSPWHWKRGISLYYLGRYADGAKQFEGYQTVDGNDVENAVWRFLCQARDPAVGFEKAQKQILPIRDDRRVPMMQVYGLYQGKLKPDDVLEAARGGDPSEETLYQRLFYAHLYLGLYHEVRGNLEAARRHIAEAERRKINHYMWDVAAVHARVLKEKSETNQSVAKKPDARQPEKKPPVKNPSDKKSPDKNTPVKNGPVKNAPDKKTSDKKPAEAAGPAAKSSETKPSGKK
jgi:lipoprotein NlpI